MKILSNESVRQISGGISIGSYESNTVFWSIVGSLTVAATVSSAPLGQYFAARLVYIGMGTVAGYAFGAAEYHIRESVKSTVDFYLAPKE